MDNCLFFPFVLKDIFGERQAACAQLLDKISPGFSMSIKRSMLSLTDRGTVYTVYTLPMYEKQMFP